MEVPSLFNIALKKSIDYLRHAIRTSHRNLNENVSPKLKQAMFDHITNSYYVFHPFVFTILSVNEIDLTPNGITENCIQELSRCEFKTLKINCSLRTYQDANDSRVYDIVGLVTACVNPETRRKLEKLKVATESTYRGDWMDTILRMLPNLQTLICKQRATTGFPTLSMAYPHLISLDVSCIALRDINGISCLMNLETLIMRNLTVSHPEDLHELFELQSLKHLDVSRYQKIGEGQCKTIEYLVQGNKVLPKLEFIDCSYLHITDTLLHRLLMLNNGIQKICLFGTDCENIGDIEAVTVLTSVDLRASLKLVDHFFEQEQFLMMHRVFEKIHRLIVEGINYNENQEILNTCFKTFVHYIDNAPQIRAIARTSAICAIRCFSFYNRHMTKEQRSRIAQVLLDSRTERVWYYWWLFNCAELHTVPELNVVGYFQRVVSHISDALGTHSTIRDFKDVVHGLETFNALYPRLDEAARRKITEISSVLSALQDMFDKCSSFLRNQIDLQQMYRIFKLICTIFRNILSGWNLDPEAYEFQYISLLKIFERVGNHGAVMPLLLGLIEMIQNRIYYKKLRKLAIYSNVARLLSPTGMFVTNDRRGIGLATYTIEVLARFVTPMKFRALRPHLTRFCVRRFRIMEWPRIWPRLFVPQCRLLDGIEVFSIEEVATPEEWATVMFDRLEEYIEQVYEHHQEIRRLTFQHFGRVVDTNVQGSPLFQIIPQGDM